MSKSQPQTAIILFALILIMVLLAACGAAASTSTPPFIPVSTWTALPTNMPEVIVITSFITPVPPDSLQQTATAIIQNATVTMQALTALASVTPPCIRGSCVASNDALTATRIIQNATGTRAFELSATFQTLTPGTPDAIQMTATAIIVGATETAQAITPFPTRTPFPPIPAAELERLRARWLGELETDVGFSHPALEETIDELVESIIYAEYTDYIQDYHVQSDVIRTEYDGSTYIAVITHNSFASFRFSSLLLFRITDGVPVLLPEMIGDGWILFFHNPHFSYNMYAGEFVDFNHNGYPEAIVYINDTGNCSPTGLMVLEITPDGEFVDLASNIPTGYQFHWVDINGDNIFEVEMIDRVFGPYSNVGCNPLFVNRYFAWDGAAYQDISTTLDESYYPAIDDFWASLDADATCVLPDRLMYQMLASAWVLGRLEEEWQRLLGVLHWEFCSSDIRATQDYEMVNLVIWIGQLLPESTPSP
jgi:hypothetical protein